MTDDEIRAEIARQIHDALALVAAALRHEAAQPGGPVARITLDRTATAVENVVKAE